MSELTITKNTKEDKLSQMKRRKGLLPCQQLTPAAKRYFNFHGLDMANFVGVH